MRTSALRPAVGRAAKHSEQPSSSSNFNFIQFAKTARINVRCAVYLETIYLRVQSRIFGSCPSIYSYPLSYGTPKTYWIETKVCARAPPYPHTKLEVRGRFKFGCPHQGIHTPNPSHAGYPTSMSNSWHSHEGIVQRNISHKYAYRRKIMRGYFRLCLSG